MRKPQTLPASLAAKMLMDNGMSEDEAWGALDWADENGEYKSTSCNVVCVYSQSGSIAYQVTGHGRGA